MKKNLIYKVVTQTPIDPFRSIDKDNTDEQKHLEIKFHIPDQI